MKDKVEASRGTKSKAYKFVKSMLKDGYDGNDVNALVNAINEHIDNDLGGQVMMDLLVNPQDVNADKKERMQWFGPFGTTWYHVITLKWAEYCKDHELQATFRFGDEPVWKEWRKEQSNVSDSEFERLIKSCDNQILVFEWVADDLESRKAMTFLDNLYQAVKESKEDKKK